MSEYIYTSFTDWNWGLAHHGIRGQKWGVRRFQNPDGSLTAAGKAHYGVSEGGNSALSRKYSHQYKKLSRLADKADVNKQAAESQKYSRRARLAAGLAAGAAGTAVGAHFDTVARNRRKYENLKSLYNDYDKKSSRILDWMHDNVGGNAAASDWKRMSDEHDRVLNSMRANTQERANLKEHMTFGTAGMSTRTKILLGGAAVAGGYAAYAGIRSKMAKIRTTDAGHAKAVEKYKQQYEKMTNMFANTPYSELLKQQDKARNKKG